MVLCRLHMTWCWYVMQKSLVFHLNCDEKLNITCSKQSTKPCPLSGLSGVEMPSVTTGLFIWGEISFHGNIIHFLNSHIFSRFLTSYVVKVADQQETITANKSFDELQNTQGAFYCKAVTVL